MKVVMVMDVLRANGNGVLCTAQKPDALRFGCFRENLHAFAFASLDIVFLAVFKFDKLGVDRKMHMPIRGVEAFLY
jgi:hypothetical protein